MRRAKVVSLLPFLRWPIGIYRMIGAKKNYLFLSGWVRSLGTFMSQDSFGAPIPWYSYPAIEFLSARIKSEMKVFEFGSGNSTFWYGSRVSEVHSVEHHKGWLEHVKKKLPSNCSIFHRELGAGYSMAAADLGVKFDIIVIDGRERNECARNSIQALKSDGIIIWDDTQRTRYGEGARILEDHGFRSVFFHGLSPIKASAKSTTIFYRTENCLGL